MSEKPSSSSRAGLAAVLLFCAGAAAWFYTDGGSSLPWEKPEQKPAVQAVTEAPAVPPVSEAVSAAKTNSSSEAGQDEKAHQVSGALSGGPEQAPPSPEEKMQARLDKALASGATLSGGDSAGGAFSQSQPQEESRRYDSVVTPHFVRDFARWLAESYVPSVHEGKAGRITATLKAANVRFSSSPSLRSAERDVLKGRTSILRYVYSPGMLQALYAMYGPLFLEDLEAAAQAGKAPLDRERTADMFRVCSAQMERVAAALEAASKVDIKALASPIRRAAAREEAANEAFGRAYAAHSEAREYGRREVMAEESERMTQSARAASEADARKNRAKNDAAWALRQKTEGAALPDSELIFLVEWLDRRSASAEATASAADICRRMAADMMKRAAELAQPAQ